MLLGMLLGSFLVATPAYAICHAGPFCFSPNCVECKVDGGGEYCDYVYFSAACGCSWVGGECHNYVPCVYGECRYVDGGDTKCSPWEPTKAGRGWRGGARVRVASGTGPVVLTGRSTASD